MATNSIYSKLTSSVTSGAFDTALKSTGAIRYHTIQHCVILYNTIICYMILYNMKVYYGFICSSNCSSLYFVTSMFASLFIHTLYSSFSGMLPNVASKSIILASPMEINILHNSFKPTPAPTNVPKKDALALLQV